MDYVAVGYVIKPQGKKGEVRVLPLTDDPERFSRLNRVFCKVNGFHVLEIQSYRLIKDVVILKFKGFDSIEHAKKLKKLYLEIPVNERVKLPADHYFISELLGMEVKTKKGRPLGKIKEILSLPGNDVYVVDDGQREHLIPALKKVVMDVDETKKIMTIDPLPGLLEEQ